MIPIIANTKLDVPAHTCIISVVIAFLAKNFVQLVVLSNLDINDNRQIHMAVTIGDNG
ncbi:hypothetical protein [Photorhabdus sp. CRCIA-P01]|uniref:hypothetical protein n=1 Tax=Photorhabdus sp. CRCIA-P01 TaxID=2019570 RepID=UPI0018E577C5